MGRQTAIVATEVDELALLHFLRSTADVRILQAAASTPQELWFTEMPQYDRYNTQFYFWNTAFAWEPDIQPCGNGVQIWDIATAPVLELDRTDAARFFSPDNRWLVASSRLYWAKHHMADTLTYEVDKFDKWYSSVIRWVRKNGRRAKEVAGAPYLLPDAWERWEELRDSK